MRGIALFEQVLVALQRVVERCGIAVLRRKAVRRAEHAHAALRRERCAKALGILQTPAGVAAAVQIEDHARAALVVRRNPRALKRAEVVLADIDLAPVHRRHQLAELVLSLACDLERAVRDERLEEIQL